MAAGMTNGTGPSTNGFRETQRMPMIWVNFIDNVWDEEDCELYIGVGGLGQRADSDDRAS